MKQAFITKPESKQTLVNLQKAYRNLPMYKRLLFRIATLPFFLWSWSSSKNPATIDPDRTTPKELSGLIYFFKHCWPVFFRNVFGIMDQFTKSALYLGETKPEVASTKTIQQLLGPSTVFSLEDFFNNSEFSTNIKQQIQKNVNTLSGAYHTKQASDAYKLIGALLLINSPQCISYADALMHKIPPQNTTDKHIYTARLKANVVIEKAVGSLPAPDFACQIKKIWQPFNDSLLASLTQEELNHLNDPIIFERIIQAVLLPDTLMMGMHPLQESVLKCRPMIAFNPRIQFIDGAWQEESKRYHGELCKEILADFQYRTLNLNYEDSEVMSFCPSDNFPQFIEANKQHYQRIIFDWSSLCGIKNGFLFLQKVLKPERMIYVQEKEVFFVLENTRSFFIPPKRIPGEMKAHLCDLKKLDVQDKWFVKNAIHPCNKNEGFCAYQRTDLPFEDSIKPKVEVSSSIQHTLEI